MTFGEKLMHVRIQYGYSIETLGLFCNINPGRLDAYENEMVIPRKYTIRKLSNSLHISWYYLLSSSCTNPSHGLTTEKYADIIWDRYGKKEALKFQKLCIESEIIMNMSHTDQYYRLVVYQTLFDSYCKSKETKNSDHVKGGVA